MVYINKLGLTLTNDIDIIADVLDVNLILQKNSIPLSADLGIFNRNYAEFNSSLEDQLELEIISFIEKNKYLSSTVSLDSISISNKLLNIKIIVTENNEDETTHNLVFKNTF